MNKMVFEKQQVGRRIFQSKGVSFTLIELLVVIAIIAVLASMLLPALGKARAKAKEIACVNNQKTMGTFFYFYWADNNDTMPVTEGVGRWTEKVGVYLDKDIIKWGGESSSIRIAHWKKSPFICPADVHATTECPLNNVRISYGCNNKFLKKDKWFEYRFPVKIAYISQPSNHLLMSETNYQDKEYCSVNGHCVVDYGPKGTRSWHGGRVNTLMIGGNVKAIPLRMLTINSGMSNTLPWNFSLCSNPKNPGI